MNIFYRAITVGMALGVVGYGGSNRADAGSSGPLHVWSSDIHDVDDGDAGGGTPSIALTCPRNGGASGKVVVGTGAIQGLKVTAGDLKQGGATIPASRITVRYGIEWDQSIRGMSKPKGNDILLESPPEGFTGKLPIWMTVKVPKDAQSGTYTGQLTVAANGLAATNVAVKLEVPDWTLPDSQDNRIWIEMVHQPDTLSVEYGLPLWSDKHWAMIEKTFTLTRDTGNRVVYVPLICGTNYGNEQSMVRWIKKGDGFDYDFSIMEKYLDAFTKNAGRPKLVILYLWDVFLNPPPDKYMDKQRARKERSSTEELKRLEARVAHSGKGPPVTAVDPASGKTETHIFPPYYDPTCKAAWKLFWAELTKRLKTRGLENAMVLGMMTDWWPSKEEAAALDEITGGTPWSICAHHPPWIKGPDASSAKNVLHGSGSVGYTVAALDFFYVINPAVNRYYGWKNPLFRCRYWRLNFFNTTYPCNIRAEPECNVTGPQRGLARTGADYWPCIKDPKTGKRVGTATDRFPQSYWHNLNIPAYLLAPGPDGPVGTGRLEVFREGIQGCEARIAIESVLTDDSLKKKLGPDLAKRAQDLLDERHRLLWKARGALDEDLNKVGLVNYTRYDYEFMNADRKSPKPWKVEEGSKWFISSGWQDRDAKLFNMAGEVERKVGK